MSEKSDIVALVTSPQTIPGHTSETAVGAELGAKSGATSDLQRCSATAPSAPLPAGAATLHASCVARDGHGVLLLGRSGAGKSDLAQRLIDRGFHLVADDQVLVSDGMASPPTALAGLLELRGIGLLRMEPVFPVSLALAVDLDGDGDRLPEPEWWSCPSRVLSLPLLRLSAWQQSAAARVDIALDCVLGRRTVHTGFIDAVPQGPHSGHVTDT